MPKASQSMPHLFAMAPLSTWIRLLWENGGAAPAYWGRMIGLLLTTSLVVPFRIVERLRYGREVARTKVEKPPVFVIGFPRSGTTHLHNMLSRDPQFGVVTNFQAAVPTFFLIGRGWLKRQMARVVPATRPMDNVAVSPDSPQEEEIALANSSHMSWLHHFSFPLRADEYLDRYVLMKGLTPKETSRWAHAFMTVVRKATLAASGRQLVLKSPVNTGRISHLLRLFPDAKFIHIVRNPYTVFLSLMHLYGKFIPAHQLQVVDIADMADHALRLYQAMMRKYLEDRQSIPPGNFSEVRFEELEARPLEELERIYADLGLSGWESAQAHIEPYCRTLSGYRKNAFHLDAAVADRLLEEWRFAFEVWPYEPPAQRIQTQG